MELSNLITLIENESGIEFKTDTRELPQPYLRAIFFQLCLDLTRGGMTLTKIGDLLERDHSTVIHARDKLMPMIKSYEPNLYRVYLRVLRDAKVLYSDKPSVTDKDVRDQVKMLVDLIPDANWKKFRSVLEEAVFAR